MIILLGSPANSVESILNPNRHRSHLMVNLMLLELAIKAGITIQNNDDCGDWISYMQNAAIQVDTVTQK